MNTASQIEGAEPAGFLAARRRDDHKAFRAAMRHSRFVHVVRVAIPAAIVIGGIAAYAAYKLLDPLQALARLPISTDGMMVAGTKVVMRQPTVKGFTKDNQPYLVTARTAAQDVTQPDLIEMQDIRATLAMSDRGKVELSARHGVYDGKAERLTLQNDVIVTSPEFEATLSEAVMYVRRGNVVSERPLSVRMLQGALNANRLEIVDSGEVVRFGGGVTLVLEPEAARIDITGTAQ